MSEAIKVFIAEDDDILRMGIELVVNAEADMEIVGTASNGREAVSKIQDLQPDVVLMDIKMPKMNGIKAIEQLKKEDPDLLIIILTTFNEEDYIIEGLANGANGYLIKGTDFELLLRTIRDVVKGQYLLPVEVAAKLAKAALKNLNKENKNVLPDFILSDNTFTKREQEVLNLLANRYTIKEIAKKLILSEGTLKNYLTVIYEKLGVKNRQEAITLLTKQEE